MGCSSVHTVTYDTIWCIGVSCIGVYLYLTASDVFLPVSCLVTGLCMIIRVFDLRKCYQIIFAMQ